MSLAEHVRTGQRSPSRVLLEYILLLSHQRRVFNILTIQHLTGYDAKARSSVLTSRRAGPDSAGPVRGCGASIRSRVSVASSCLWRTSLQLARRPFHDLRP